MRAYILTRQFLSDPEGEQGRPVELCPAGPKALHLGFLSESWTLVAPQRFS